MQSTNLKPDDKPTEGGRALADDWYLKVYGIRESRRRSHFRRFVDSIPNAKHFGIAVVVGLGVGLAIAVVRVPRQTPSSLAIQARVRNSGAPAPLVPATPAVNPEKAELQRAVTAAPAKVSPAVAAPPAADSVSTSELERIKARNRRLEALIEVLRQRQHTPERKGTSLSANIYGQ